MTMADFLDPSSISPNISSLGQDDDPVKLFRCWIRQSCDDCISMRDDLDCSWCPFVCSLRFLHVSSPKLILFVRCLVLSFLSKYILAFSLEGVL